MNTRKVGVSGRGSLGVDQWFSPRGNFTLGMLGTAWRHVGYHSWGLLASSGEKPGAPPTPLPCIAQDSPQGQGLSSPQSQGLSLTTPVTELNF